jgi:hypothetical protein
MDIPFLSCAGRIVLLSAWPKPNSGVGTTDLPLPENHPSGQIRPQQVEPVCVALSGGCLRIPLRAAEIGST